MALKEVSVIDSINVRDTGHIEVRRADRIIKDGEQIAERYHRHVLTPGDDLGGEDVRVGMIARVAWADYSPEELAAFQTPPEMP